MFPLPLLADALGTLWFILLVPAFLGGIVVDQMFLKDKLNIFKR